MNKEILVREIKKEDKFEANKINAICFHERIDDIESLREEWEKDTSEDWGAFTKDNVIMARIINNHFTSYVNNIEVKTGGVGGVCTLPEYRNMGAVREIFNKLIPQAYKNGEIVSLLAPFSFAFYRKFGYEVCSYQNDYEFKVEILKDYSFDGEVHMFKEGDSIDEYTNLFTNFITKYNLGMKRTNEQMRYHIKRNVFKNRCFSYLLKKNNEALAYVFIKDKYEEEAAKMIVKEAIWKNKEGFDAILGFLARFSADYGKISLRLPSNIEFLSVIHTDKGYSVDKEPNYGYMVRAINARRLLEILPKVDNTRFVIKVNDELIKENNKCFLVTNDKVIETNEDYDINVDIQTFSCLVVNAISLEEAKLRDNFELKNNEKLLSKIFVKKSIMKTEVF